MRHNVSFDPFVLFFLLAIGAAFARAQSSSLEYRWSSPPAPQVALGLFAWQRSPIEGFAWPTSVKPGETVTFYTSVLDTVNRPNYRIKIYRLGNATPLLDLGITQSHFYPLRADDGTLLYPGNTSKRPVDFKLGCSSWWASSARTFTIPGEWQSGLYYAIMTPEPATGDAASAYFIVRSSSPGSASKVLYKFPVNTYQAYNWWGGGSLYSCSQDGSSLASTDTIAMDRPLEPQADSLVRVASMHKYFIEWAENNGYAMEYCDNTDVDKNEVISQVNFLSNYKVIVHIGHDEYWSGRPGERQNEEDFKGAGNNLAFFAGNSCYWRITWLPNSSGLVDYKRLRCIKAKCDGGTNADLWRNPSGLNNAEALFIGSQFEIGYNNEVMVQPPAKVFKGNHWIFDGTNLQNGDEFGFGADNSGQKGILGWEIDNTVTGKANFPLDTLLQRRVWSVVNNSTSPVQYDSVLHQATYYEDTLSNARVFNAATIQWARGFAEYYDVNDRNRLSQITKNILDHFSGKKFIGQIYHKPGEFIVWKTNTEIDGEVYVGNGKVLRLSDAMTLTIDPGKTLYVDGTLTIDPSVTISLAPGATIVVRNGGTLNAQGTPGARITFDGQNYAPPTSIPNYWELATIRFYGSGSGTISYADFKNAKYQLYASAAGNLSVANCTFTNFGFTGGYGGNGGNGIEVFQDPSLPPVGMGSLSITNNTFSGTSKLGYGIVLANTQPSSMTISGNLVQDCYIGVLTHKMSGSVGSNTVNSCTYAVAGYNQTPSMSGLTLSGNTYGFYFDLQSTASLSNCTVTNIGEHGIYVTNGSGASVQSVTISSTTGADGIYAVGTNSRVNVFASTISSMMTGVVIDNGATGVIGQCGGNGGNSITTSFISVKINSNAPNIQVMHNTIQSSTGTAIQTIGSPLIEYNNLNGTGIGLSVNTGAPSSIKRNNFSNFDGALLLLPASSPPSSGNQYTENNFENNSTNVYNSTTIGVSMPGNWWGICPTTDITSKMHGPVYFDPFTNSPIVGTGPCGTGAGGPGCPPVGLVASWPFEGNTNDSSPYANNGQNNGATFTTGRVGQAISFTGGSYVLVPRSSSLQPSNITLEAWVKPATLGSDDVPIAMANGGCGTGWPYGFDLVSGGYVRTQVYAANGQFYQTVSTSKILTGFWSHVAATYDGTALKVYINGQLNGQTATGAGNLSYGNWLGDIGIGKKLDMCYANYYTGLLDEIRIYNRALSDAEIQQHYNDATPTPTITVISPNGGEVLGGGSSTTLSWYPERVADNVNLDYSTDAGASWVSIVTNVINTGTYIWTVPNAGTSQARVRVIAVSGSPSDQSDGVFTISSSDPSLVGYWKFDGNLTDFSGRGNNLTGSQVSYATGRAGQGLQLSGVTSSFAYAPDQTYYHIANPTIEAWVNCQTPNLPNTVVCLSTQGAWADGRGFVLQVESSKLALIVGNASGVWKLVWGTPSLQANTWYHVAGLYDGSQLRLYVNGQPDASLSIGYFAISYTPNLALGPNPSTLYIGVQHNAYNTAPDYVPDLHNPFRGMVDEVRIYNRPLSSSEIQQHYSGQFASQKAADPEYLVIENPAQNLPTQFSLSQNHPNPFNPETIVQYALPITSHVSLKIYDVLGREVRVLADREEGAGYYSVKWDGKDNSGKIVSSGIYLYRLLASGNNGGDPNKYVSIKKMLVAK